MTFIFLEFIIKTDREFCHYRKSCVKPRGDTMGQFMPYLWVLIAVVLGIVELSTTQLVSVWFVISATITAIASATFIYDNIWLQLLMFVLLSAVCLSATRPLVKKLRKNQKVRTNSDRFIGRTGKVISDIGHNTYTGQVEVDGSKWTAATADDSFIKAGTKVKIQSIQGVKLIVTPVDNEKEI